MLPPELLTLVLLATGAYANPFPQQVAAENNTLTTSGRSTIVAGTSPAFAHPESTETGFESDPTPTSIGVVIDKTSGAPFIIIQQPTETGFETNNEPESTKPYSRNTPHPSVIVVKTPTVIQIQTNVAPTSGYHPNEPGHSIQGPGDQGPGSPGSGGTQTPAGNAQTPPQPTSGGDSLLTDIISHIARPGAQPTASSAPTYQSSPDDPQEMQQGTAFVTPGQMAQPTIVVGESITVGPDTLVLTPGLSTTVWVGTEATFVGISTGGTGQTIITVSSSGTAVTATITEAPITMTTPATGFDAIITEAATPGSGDQSSRLGGAAATTSSKGDAPDNWGRTDWWAAFVIGILGFSVVL